MPRWLRSIFIWVPFPVAFFVIYFFRSARNFVGSDLDKDFPSKRKLNFIQLLYFIIATIILHNSDYRTLFHQFRSKISMNYYGLFDLFSGLLLVGLVIDMLINDRSEYSVKPMCYHKFKEEFMKLKAKPKENRFFESFHKIPKGTCVECIVNSDFVAYGQYNSIRRMHGDLILHFIRELKELNNYYQERILITENDGTIYGEILNPCQFIFCMKKSRNGIDFRAKALMVVIIAVGVSWAI